MPDKQMGMNTQVPEAHDHGQRRMWKEQDFATGHLFLLKVY